MNSDVDVASKPKLLLSPTMRFVLASLTLLTVFGQQLPDPHETMFVYSILFKGCFKKQTNSHRYTHVSNKKAQYVAEFDGCMDILTISARSESPMIVSLLNICGVIKHDRYGKVVCGKLDS
jgi:hypothetical protein